MMQKLHGEFFFILSIFDKHDKTQLLAKFKVILSIGFRARLWPCGKNRSLRGPLESTKKNGSLALFALISLGSQQNECRHKHFNERKKRMKGLISSQISLEFAVTYRKKNTFINILKLHEEWFHKNDFWYVLLIKKNGCSSTFDFSDSLTPVKLKYSLLLTTRN